MSPANIYVKQPYELDKKPHINLSRNHINSSRNHNITRQATVLALTYVGPSDNVSTVSIKGCEIHFFPLIFLTCTKFLDDSTTLWLLLLQNGSADASLPGADHKKEYMYMQHTLRFNVWSILF